MQTMENAKIPFGWFEVPGGLLVENEGEIRRYNKIQLREMRGWEEDIISNTKMDIVERFLKIIGRCTESVEDENGNIINRYDGNALSVRILDSIGNKLLTSDNTVLLLGLRSVSIGDDYAFKIRCPGCHTLQSKRVKLSDFDIKPVIGDPKCRIRTYVTRNGLKITWEMATGATQKFISSSGGKRTEDEKATLALLMRIKTIDDEPVEKNKLKDLSLYDRQMLRKEFEKEGGIDTSYDIKCTACSLEFGSELVIGEDFFIPSEPEENQ